MNRRQLLKLAALGVASQALPSKAEPSALRQLQGVDPELAYLAVLTRRGLKPLSRWEQSLDESVLQQFPSLGLQSEIVTRRALNGTSHQEVIFSPHSWALEAYHEAFQGRSFETEKEDILLEGFLFGYPPCCTAAFANAPYGDNSLKSSEQANLFHWACPQCKITPLLLPHYQNLWKESQSAHVTNVNG